MPACFDDLPEMTLGDLELNLEGCPSILSPACTLFTDRECVYAVLAGEAKPSRKVPVNNVQFMATAIQINACEIFDDDPERSSSAKGNVCKRKRSVFEMRLIVSET